MKAEEENIPAEIQNEQPENVEVTLTLNGTTQYIVWNRQIPLLDALLNAGVDAPHSCCRGTCGTCVCKLEEGEVRLKRNFILSEAQIQQGLILACVSVPISDSIKINYDKL
ncbi:2Fe-2S iron-sulfur cluster-binding protein [Sphingobacterium arenae]|uniref:2Fe-2S iron-sulfur cluster binding domain-containing protein n=1 Tax=Sphingobacterium arenae TaxID=1280598 RepID=A0ABR7Y3L9_9SPHI|nr:2Fe-2S iron-sulfur cluster binding domain-containing protein [Sphingobacterium arenae]MBD1425910.1 2Fe-2S iron-sulfur cluster binding domain-containing protein [Sphingobacterium arenae]